MNCCVAPTARVGFCGLTLIDTSETGVTLSVVLPEIELDVAVIVVVPAATPVATPCVPVALLMVAIHGDEELQVTMVVRSCLLPSV